MASSIERRAGRLPLGIAVAVLAAVLATPLATRPTRAIDLGLPTGLSQLLASTVSATASIRGIAEFAAVPSAGEVAGLEALGLIVQPMRHVPLALVEGTIPQMQAAVTTGVAADVYPDDALQLFD